jgi:hypothetical protein
LDDFGNSKEFDYYGESDGFGNFGDFVESGE